MFQVTRSILSQVNRPLFGVRYNSSTDVKEANGVREIILNQPKNRNALSLDMMDSILRSLVKDRDDERLRCIVLSSTGPIWSSGHNIKELANGEPDIGERVFNKLGEIVMCIRNLPVPVIAKVNGVAAAGGCQLVASCDFAVSSDKSSFMTPGGNFGIFCSNPGVALTRTTPRSIAAYMVMTGLPLSAQEAHVAGIVSRVVPEAELDKEMEKITHAILSKSRSVVASGKQFFYEQLNMNIEEALQKGAQQMAEGIKRPDGVEGVSSFVEKRKAKWSHK